MIADVLLAAIAITGTGMAAYVDIKTREVPNLITYTLIASALIIRFLHAVLFAEWGYFFFGVMGFLIMAGAGMLLYLTRQWGGGDTKLLMALGALFGTRPWFVPASTFSFPFLAVLLINIAIVGALYGLCASLILAARNWKEFKEKYKELGKEPRMKNLKIVALIVGVVSVIALATQQGDQQLRLTFSAIIVLILVYPYLSLLIRAVEQGTMIKKKLPSELTEGDWVEQDVYKKSVLVYKRKPLGIEKQDILLLIKEKIPYVIVKEGIAFIPPFFIGLLITLITGEIVFV